MLTCVVRAWGLRGGEGEAVGHPWASLWGGEPSTQPHPNQFPLGFEMGEVVKVVKSSSSASRCRAAQLASLLNVSRRRCTHASDVVGLL